jgi:hypothetical protein
MENLKKRHNTKFTRSIGQVKVYSFPRELSHCDGLLPLRAVLDLTVGMEVGLYWLDHSQFVHELAAIRPFQLFLKTGLYRSSFGPLFWMLFYVPNPAPIPQPFAAMECHVNPNDIEQVAILRQLANQTHWHLTLLGQNNSVADFFEFENNYDLDNALDVIQAIHPGNSDCDFALTKQEFSENYSLEDLYRMKSRRSDKLCN